MATAFSEPPANALLESASLEGDVSGVLSALSLGASVDATDSSGYAALHNATFAGKHALQVFEALLAAGADPNARTTENQETPLHLIHNADTGIDWKLCTGSIDGRGSFFSAALVELLIKHGAKVNAKASDGSTALHAAAEAGATATVMALLHAGADVDARDAAGRTAIELAGKSASRPMAREHLQRLRGLLDAAKAGAPNAAGFSLCGAPARGMIALAFQPPAGETSTGGGDGASASSSSDDEEEEEDTLGSGLSWAAALAAVPTSLPTRLYGEPPPPPPKPARQLSSSTPLSPSRKRSGQAANIAAGSPSPGAALSSPARKAVRRGSTAAREQDRDDLENFSL